MVGRLIFDRVRATRSPAVLEKMHRELTLMHDILDPAAGLLAAVIAEHLDYHFPKSRAVFQGEAATRHAIADRQFALKKWARRDPEAAFAFALNEPVVNHRPMMLEAVLEGAVQNDPDAAYRLWSTLTDPDLRHRLAKSIARGAAKVRPEQHAEWAAALVALNELEMAGEDVRSARQGLLAGVSAEAIRGKATAKRYAG